MVMIDEMYGVQYSITVVVNGRCNQVDDQSV